MCSNVNILTLGFLPKATSHLNCPLLIAGTKPKRIMPTDMFLKRILAPSLSWSFLPLAEWKERQTSATNQSSCPSKEMHGSKHFLCCYKCKLLCILFRFAIKHNQQTGSTYTPLRQYACSNKVPMIELLISACLRVWCLSAVHKHLHVSQRLRNT